MKNKSLIIILSIIAALLLIPFTAMLFSVDGVDWNLLDFVIMGILLTLTGLGIELVLRKVKNTRQRIVICGAVLFVFFLVWAELAVGVFGSPFAGS